MKQLFNLVNSLHLFIVTPLDVIKIRIQAQQNAMPSNKCFIYCNGLMDHLCPCVNGNSQKGTTVASHFREQWYKRPGQFNGTLVGA